MKDPLQMQETPYEVLGVSLTAQRSEIDAAFKKGVATGGDLVKKRTAWTTLSKSVERALVDVFLYKENYVHQLIPRIHEDISQLLNRRMDVALAWSNIQKKLFPHYPSTHSLALLWYWWTLYCEYEQWASLNNEPFDKKDNCAEPPPFEQLWRNTICHWVYLIKSDDFWRKFIQLRASQGVIFKDENIKYLSQKVEDHFINLLHTFSEKYRNIGDNTSIKRYQKYERLFLTEIKSAKRLRQEGVYTTNQEKQSRINCGRMMLESVGLLDSIKKRLQEQIQEDLNNDKLISLLFILSPFADIMMLVERKKFDEAIEEIKRLSKEQQRQEEIARILAKVYLEKGRQYFELEQFDTAFDSWKEGLKTNKLYSEIKEIIVSCCQKKAGLSQKKNLDLVIHILESAIQVISNVKLKKLLSNAYCERGIQRILEAQKVQKQRQQEWVDKQGSKKRVKNEFKNGVSDLRTAVEMDPSNKRADGQLAIGEGLLSDLDFFDIYDDMNNKRHALAAEKLRFFIKQHPRNKKAKEILQACETYLCYFCKGVKNAPDDKAAYKVKMYGNVQHVFSRIQWKTLDVTVPRCPRCKSVHTKGSIVNGFFIILGICLGLGPCVTISDEPGTGILGPVVFAVIIAVFVGIGHAISGTFSKGVTNESTGNQYPTVKEMISRGWSIGEKPPNVQ